MQHHSHLPNEVLGLILTHVSVTDDLYQCALVNKFFYTEVIPLLWRDPAKCQMNFDQVAFPLLNCLQSTRRHLGHSIRRLEFSRDDSAATILSLLAYTPLIEELDLKEIRLDSTDPYLDQIFFLCPRLKSLHLFLLTLNDTALTSLGKSCSELVHLNLSTCVGFSGYTFDSLLSSTLVSLTLTNLYSWSSAPTPLGALPQLVHLDLSYCRDITASMIHQCHLPRLRTCRIVRCHVNFASDPDDALVVFLRTHPLLEKLVLEYCKVDDRTLVLMSHLVLKKLTELDLVCNGHPISSKAIRQLVKSCPSLTFVGLDFCGLPARSFPETDQIHVAMGNLARDDIIRIRLAPDLESTDEIVHEEEDLVDQDDDALFMGNLSLEDI